MQHNSAHSSFDLKESIEAYCILFFIPLLCIEITGNAVCIKVASTKFNTYRRCLILIR